jgi:hypothetical protein
MLLESMDIHFHIYVCVRVSACLRALIKDTSPGVDCFVDISLNHIYYAYLLCFMQGAMLQTGRSRVRDPMR